ncbi:hypothetical protein GCM10008933_19990 [Paenibacillus motobuensis]|uniref:Uncharacterized protein n=1 Tax=Paenibacillus motobuensis TaxID=295324 RepID=A0ABN0YAI7_9BACL
MIDQEGNRKGRWYVSDHKESCPQSDSQSEMVFVFADLSDLSNDIDWIHFGWRFFRQIQPEQGGGRFAG